LDAIPQITEPDLHRQQVSQIEANKREEKYVGRANKTRKPNTKPV
jgi:hypothetical protein